MMERQRFVITGIDTYSRYEFIYPAWHASAKTTIQGLTECLSNFMVLHTALPLPLTTALTLQLKKYGSGLMLTEFTGLTMFPIILKQLD